MQRIKMFGALAALVFMSACASLPRGAALQEEITAANADGTKDFALYSVTSQNLSRMSRWPQATGKHYPWLKHTHGSTNRVIARGDMVRVTIWDSDENTLFASPGQKVVDLKPMTVANDGSIFVPYIDRIKISGLTQDRARARIQTGLADLIPSAQVQLEVTPGRNSGFNLVSGVNSPGSYPLESNNTTVLDAVSLGGGISPALRNPQIRVQRGHTTYGTSMARLYEKPSLNGRIQGSDKIIIQSDDRYFLSLGAAGLETLHHFPKDKVSALDAVSLMGGVSDNRGTPKGLLILREYPGSAVGRGPTHRRTVFTLDLTNADGLFSAGAFEVQSEDLIYVSESPITAAGTILGLIGAVFGLANTAGNL